MFVFDHRVCHIFNALMFLISVDNKYSISMYFLAVGYLKTCRDLRVKAITDDAKYPLSLKGQESAHAKCDDFLCTRLLMLVPYSVFVNNYNRN